MRWTPALTVWKSTGPTVSIPKNLYVITVWMHEFARLINDIVVTGYLIDQFLKVLLTSSLPYYLSKLPVCGVCPVSFPELHAAIGMLRLQCMRRALSISAQTSMAGPLRTGRALPWRCAMVANLV